MSKNISIYLDAFTEQRLRKLAADTKCSVSFYVRELINHGLEDIEDYYRAEMVSACIRSGKEKVYSEAQVRHSIEQASVVRTKNQSLLDMAGMLYAPKQKKVSVDAMNAWR